MPLDPLALQAVHANIRAAFKDQLKSSNKVYEVSAKADLKHGCDAKKRLLRNQNAKIAHPLIQERRKQFNRIMNRGEIGFRILDQDELCGNCPEMCLASAYLVMQRKLGQAWKMTLRGNPDHAFRIDHVFCLVVEDARTLDFRSMADLRRSALDAWVIDPWANLCCRMQDYERALNAKLRAWSRIGKRVICASQITGQGIPLDPGSSTYISVLLEGDLVGAPVDAYGSGQELPRGLKAALECRVHKPRLPPAITLSPVPPALQPALQPAVQASAQVSSSRCAGLNCAIL